MKKKTTYPYRYLLTTGLFVLLFIQQAIAQQAPSHKIFYVDSVAIFKMDNDDNKLTKKEIAVMRMITSPDTIAQLDLINVDTIIYVITRAYLQRPDSIRRIPSLPSLSLQNGVLYEKDSSSVPYSGPYRDYYLNGALKSKGYIKNGYIDGYVNRYFKDGYLKSSHYFAQSVEDGVREEYYPTGSIHKRGNVRNGYMEGIWQEWHSTGKLKSEIRYLHSRPFYQDGEDVFYDMLAAIPALISMGEYRQALGKLDACKKANPNAEEIFYYYGLAYIKMKRLADAYESLSKAVNMEPLYIKARQEKITTTVALLEDGPRADAPEQGQLKASLCSDIKAAISQGQNKPEYNQWQQSYCTVAPAS